MKYCYHNVAASVIMGFSDFLGGFGFGFGFGNFGSGFGSRGVWASVDRNCASVAVPRLWYSKTPSQ